MDGCRFASRNRGDEAISMPRDRFDEPRILRVIVESGAELFQDDVEASLEVDMRIGWPKILSQLLARNDLAGSLQKQNKHTKGLVLDFDAHAVAGQRVTGNIRLK
jgi:hypothetical protein